MSRSLLPSAAQFLVAASAWIFFALPSGAQSRTPNTKARPAATSKAATPTKPAPTIAPPKPISFNNDIVPIFTRAGCNQGACHGAQFGKGGYKLSLAGFDADLD